MTYLGRKKLPVSTGSCFFALNIPVEKTLRRSPMSPALSELHLLLKQAEAYAEQLAQVEEKICKYCPEFKEFKAKREVINETA